MYLFGICIPNKHIHHRGFAFSDDLACGNNAKLWVYSQRYNFFLVFDEKTLFFLAV